MPPTPVPTPRPAPVPRWALAAAALVAMLAATLPFAPALTAGLVEFDDLAIIESVDGYRGLNADNLRWMFSTTHMGHYQPLTWLSYAIDHALWGMRAGLKPAGFHITNVALHAANALLLLLVARRLLHAAAPATPERWLLAGATAAAVLFALHPLRVESVAWITERRDVLSTAFLLASVLAYLRAFPSGAIRPASQGWYAASIALLLISLLCKAWGMTLIATLVTLDLYPLRRLPLSPRLWLRPAMRPILVQKLPYLALGLAAAATAAYATRSVAFTAISLTDWGIPDRLCQAAYGLTFYIHKLVAPINLACLYELPLHEPLAQPRFLIPILLVLGAAVLIWKLRAPYPGLPAAAAVYTITLAPVLGFMQSGPQLVADRYSYIANMPWALLLGGALAWWLALASPKARVLTAAACLAAAVLLGTLTWRQTTLWRSTESLFRHSIDAGADGPIARLNLARFIAARGRHDEALDHLRRAVELNPRYGEAWFAAGWSLGEVKRFADAEAAYKNAALNMADSWRANLMLARLYTNDLDRLDQAEAALRAAIVNVEAPGAPTFSPLPYLRLAEVLYDKGDDAGARAMLLKAAAHPETREAAENYLKQLDTPP